MDITDEDGLNRRIQDLEEQLKISGIGGANTSTGERHLTQQDIEGALQLHLQRPLRPKERLAVSKMLEVQDNMITETLFDAVLLAIPRPRHSHARQRSGAQMYHLARRMSHFRDLSNRATPVKPSRHLPASDPQAPRRLSTELSLKNQRVWDVDVEMSLRGDPAMYAPASPATRRWRRAARPQAIPLAKRTRDVVDATPGARSVLAAVGGGSAAKESEQQVLAGEDGYGSDREQRLEKGRSTVGSTTEAGGIVTEQTEDTRHTHANSLLADSPVGVRQDVPPDKLAPEPAPEAKSVAAPRALEDAEDSEEPKAAAAGRAQQPPRPTANPLRPTLPSTAVAAAGDGKKRQRRRGFGCCSSSAAGDGDVKRAEGEAPQRKA